MEKWFSRKLFVAILVVCLTVILRAKNLIGDWPAVVLILVSTSIYTLVNGAIKIEALKINSEKFVIDLSGEEDENDNDNR